jgi:hypothetical protein
MIFTDATGVQTSLRAYSRFLHDCSEFPEAVNEHYERALTPQTNAPTKRNGDFLSDGIMLIIFVP